MLKCPRCALGVDDDNDGNCRVCAKWSDIELPRKLRAVIYLLTEGKEFTVQFLRELRIV